jgi:glucose/arabinose dehydrogenase
MMQLTKQSDLADKPDLGTAPLSAQCHELITRIKAMTSDEKDRRDQNLRYFLIRIVLVAVIVLLVLLRSNFWPVQAQSQISISVDSFLPGLTQPVYVTHAGDGSNRLFIVEQPGTIRVVRNGVLLATPFLDIRSRVTAGGERGLLSVVFHPHYRDNGRFFVNYTASRPNLKTIIAEYQVSSDPDISQTAESVILTIDQPFDNHNGGQLQFGPDGYLYIGMGDGGSGGDPQGNGQNLNVLLGKILRIDIDSIQPYAIPAQNPFLNRDGRDEIYAVGLRNPWRFSFDRLTGRLFAGDVGQNTREEIDLIVRGENYGWNRYEASLCFNPATGCEASAESFQFPIAEYGRTEGASVTGGFVYRGKAFPELNGTYIFGDFISGRVWALQETQFGSWSRTKLLDTGFNISSFGEDESGEMYIVNYAGSVGRLRLNNPKPSSYFLSLIPSSAKTDRFTSSLFLINRDTQQNQLVIRSQGLNGELRTKLTINLIPGESLWTEDILTLLGLSTGAYGPLTIESVSGLQFSAVSEVRSRLGTGGFFRERRRLEESTVLIIPDLIDDGERGKSGTFRTNLGINNVGDFPAGVLVSLIDDRGIQRASRAWTVPPMGMTQIDSIVRTMLPALEASEFRGYANLTSDQPVHAWASKIDNTTDDPSFEPALGPTAVDRGPQLLIPSVVSSDRFKSSLVVINTRSNAAVTARMKLWSVTGELVSSTKIELGPSQAYYREDIVAEAKAPSGFFGPLTIETDKIDAAALAVVSDVRSPTGTGGFFPGHTPSSASVQQVVPEIVDTGNRGSAGTYRTNLGLNNSGGETAHITIDLADLTGSTRGTLKVDVLPNGLNQINDVARLIIGKTDPTGFHGYLKIRSSQPIYSWVSKIDNGTDDPSIIAGIP